MSLMVIKHLTPEITNTHSTLTNKMVGHDDGFGHHGMLHFEKHGVEQAIFKDLVL